MPRIAGIATRKNTKGKITHITIDVKKHPDLAQPLLEQAGLNEKLSFKEEWEEIQKSGYTVEEARTSTLEIVRSLPWKK